MLLSPNFIVYPFNNNRTAWKPVKFPIILVATNRYDKAGSPIANSEIFNVRIYIENVPREARVAGHQYIGMRFPDRELYSRNIQPIELSDKYIPLEAFRTIDNEPVINPKSGDILQYVTSTGITSTIEYTQGAEYYDLSDVDIEVEQLPSDIYNIVYECSFYNRIVSSENQEELLCIDTTTTAISEYRILINHPGEILEEMFNRTPGILFTAQNKSDDQTIALYRPFADVMQNVMDEQNILRSLNWVYDAPSESIPLISDLLGWNVPYFPKSLDKLRKAVLRKTVELQHLKGSKQAIVELFKLFGFEILITNLWISKDGSRLIRPNQTLPKAYKDQEIYIDILPQIDAIFSNYITSGYGSLDIPLLYRPQEVVGLDNFASLQNGGNVTLDAYVVEIGSPAQLALQTIIDGISANPGSYGASSDYLEVNGYLLPTVISESLADLDVIGHSRVLISGKFGDSTDEILNGGEPPLSKIGCKLDRRNNKLSITFNGHINFDNTCLYAFAIYKKAEYNIPEELKDLQSNWFDIQLLNNGLTESADPVTLEFAIEFLRNVKAFHSLLNVISQRIELNDDYEVTDLKIGGNIKQRYDIDFGRLQVPPAIIPLDPSNSCTSQDPRDLGYKESDILYRNHKIQALIEEFESASLIENGPQYNQNRTTENRSDDIEYNYINPLANANQGDSQSISTIDPSFNTYTANGDSSNYSSFTREFQLSRETYEELDGVQDYYYAGRIHDDLLYQTTIKLDDYVTRQPCLITYGYGVYWTYPLFSRMTKRGVSANVNGSVRVQFTSGRKNTGETVDGVQKSYFESKGNVTADTISNINIMYRKSNASTEVSLHYSNRPAPEHYDQNWYLALNKPSLEVTKAYMHLPGCRFPRYNNKTTYTHPTYNKKPFDDKYCDDPTFMGASLSIGSDGDQILVYPDVPIVYLGNNIDSDIISFGSHAGYADDPNKIIHKIYLDQYNGHPAIEWDDNDQVSEPPSDIISVTDPIFNSYNDCGTEILDYSNGYGSVVGWQTISNPKLSNNTDRDGLYAEIFEAMDYPEDPTTPTQVLFLYGSGVQIENGYRYGCGCVVTPCDDTTEEPTTLCYMDELVDEDGLYNYDYDDMEVTSALVLNESIGVQSTYFNGYIPSFLELL